MARKFKKSKKVDGFNKLQLVAQSLGRVKFNEKLKFHTFSQSEGEAEGFFIATNQRELTGALDTCLELKVPYFIIGGGTKTIISSQVKGLVIKNMTQALKVAGVKGKISKTGIGVEEMFVEAESGVTLALLNDFLDKQNLEQVDGMGSPNSTIGGTILIDPKLREATQSLRIWEDSEVTELKVDSLKRDQVVVSVIFKFKAKA